MLIIKRIKHLIWLYFDLCEHKKQGRIKSFKIRWNSYSIIVTPVLNSIYEMEIKYELE